ncbi:unnamed protein product [Amoebophrya sp. A25]|nr:unnamed protein product [Amoebophrya sp. A25]|eukprot:GSA25T00005122001.1
MSGTSVKLKPPIVVDTGTGGVKAGVAGDKFPTLYLPNCVARPVARVDAAFSGGFGGAALTGSSASSSSSGCPPHKSFGRLEALRNCPWINHALCDSIIAKWRPAPIVDSERNPHHGDHAGTVGKNAAYASTSFKRQRTSTHGELRMGDDRNEGDPPPSTSMKMGGQDGLDAEMREHNTGGASAGGGFSENGLDSAAPVEEEPMAPCSNVNNPNDPSSIHIGPHVWRYFQRGDWEFSCPMREGQVENWEDMEAVWDYIFHEMAIDPAEHTTVQTEPVLTPMKNREILTEMMFERYGFKALHVGVQGVLSLYAEGLRTGLVVDSGDGCTHIVPVYQGFVQPAHVERMNIAGRHVTKQLHTLLSRSNVAMNSYGGGATISQAAVAEVKESACYVAFDFEAERRLHATTSCIEKVVSVLDHRCSAQMRRLRIGEERFLAPEIMWNPTMFQEMSFDFGHQNAGLGQFVYETVMKTDIDLRRAFFGSILLSGGNTLFPGFKSRLERELVKLYSASVNPHLATNPMTFRVEDPPRRKFMVFLGASYFAETSYQDCDYSRFLTQAEYEEIGAHAIHSYCMPKY